MESKLVPADAIASVHSLTTPFGRGIAYSALFDGCSFTTVKSTELYKTGKGEYTLHLTLSLIIETLAEAALDHVAELLAVPKSGFPSPTVLFLYASLIKVLDILAYRYFPATRHTYNQLLTQFCITPSSRLYSSSDGVISYLAFNKAMSVRIQCGTA